MNRATRFTAVRLVVAAGIAGLASLAIAVAEESLRTGPQTEARFPPLKVPPGFKATLFACDPLIEYPSAIAAGPRPGTIFVAVDYMTGLGTEIVRRSEVRLVEDTDGDGYADRARVFAGEFNSIQGLTWHDGTLFVMHAPFLTALRDTQAAGTAKERTDLLSGLGLTPEDNPVRLHCANGVTVGHDGWLYLALGDHGCDVQRPEGDRLIFQGGGILRCRRDGRDLHVFATGLRNIYDVALDAELNVFVRDNENDGGTYKIRVCHSFHGADHGYPYLYDVRPEEALAPLADLGLGSSAGGICYLETQFPQEYRGNLLFCEWGKSLVRYPLEKRGSSFTSPKEIEMAAGAPNDTYGFKPTDVVVQRDGTIMVSDYADGQRPKRGRGRIYQIAHVGEGPTPKPNAAVSDSNRADLLAQLDAQSYFERCDAQAALERQGTDGEKNILDALGQSRLGPRARLHAIWILAHLRGPSAIEDLMKLGNSDPEPSVRAQAVRAIADLSDPILTGHRLDAGSGNTELAARIAALANGQHQQVLLEILIALGRLRWPGTAEWLGEHLTDPDAALAHAAQQSLRRSGNWPAILKLLDAPHTEPLRVIALRALAEQYQPTVVDGLIERLRGEKNASRRREHADLLTRVYKKPGPWTYWGYRPPPRPANTLAWERTDAIAQAIDSALSDPDPVVRLAVLQRMQREKIPASLPTLGRWLSAEREPQRVAAILSALEDCPAAEARPHLVAVISDSQHTSTNRRAALAHFINGIDDSAAEELLSLARTLEDGPVLADALRRTAKFYNLPAAPLLTSKLSSAESEVRAAAVEALGGLRAIVQPTHITTLLADRDASVRSAAAGAAGKLAIKEAVEPLLNLTSDTEPSVRRACFDALRQLKEQRAVALALPALNDRQVNLQALECLADLGGPAHASAVADLARREPSTELLGAAIRVLTDWRNRKDTSTPLQQELDHAVAEIHGASGVLVRFGVVGPIPTDSAPSLIERLTSGETVANIPVARTLFATGAEARVLVAPKEKAQSGVWLAHTTLHVTDPTAVQFLASTGGSLQVWLNGKSLHRRDESRTFRTDSDRFNATLVKGDNRLLVAIGPTAAAPAEFHLRFRQKSATQELERLTQTALTRAGDPERGRLVFLNTEKSLCLKCHRVGDLGERTGPELTGVGSRFSRIYLIESILEPSRTIAPSFGTLTVLLSNGQTLSGVKSAETETTITLADIQGQKHFLAKADIDDQKPSSQSTMPEGLEKRLTEAEFIDLSAYLLSLKEIRIP